MRNKQLRETLATRQGGQCFWCGQPFDDLSLTDIARVTPKREGGTYELSNLMLLHARCNMSRNGTTRSGDVPSVEQKEHRS
jgi:hypothetical protein